MPGILFEFSLIDMVTALINPSNSTSSEVYKVSASEEILLSANCLKAICLR